MAKKRSNQAGKQHWLDFIRDKIEDYRAEHEISLLAFSKLCGVSQVILHMLQTGKRTGIKLDSAEKICRFLQIDLREPDSRAA